MAIDPLEALLAYIPILQAQLLKDAHSIYISTGEYPPQVRDLQQQLKKSCLAQNDEEWLTWAEEAQPYLQDPEKILSADPESFSKLIALATFSEKFNRSLFPHLCSSGFIEMLLRRIERDTRTLQH